MVTLIDALYDGMGGGERFAAALAAALPRDRFEVTVCATRTADGVVCEALERAGVRHIALERRGPVDLAPFRRLTSLLRRERVQVLHAHKFGSNVWGALLGRASRVPVVIAHEHTWSYEGQPVRKLLDGRVIAPLATRFVAVSELDRRRMIEIEGVKPEKAVAIPTAYLPREGVPDAGDLRARLGIAPGAPVIGTVANLRHQKRLDVLIDAFARVREQVEGAQLVLAGDGPEAAALRAAAESRRLGDEVHLPGVIEDLQSAFRAFDVAVMSSDFEGMPLFMFEAMAHDTPLVATRVGGLPEVVEHGTHALLVPRRDPAALAGALTELLTDPARRDALARAASVRLRDFSLEAVADRFAALYEDLLRERGGR